MTRTVHVYSHKGEKLTESLEFDFLPKKLKPSLLHQFTVDYLAHQRSGTANTKTRAEVRGGGIKPWPQKGTGRARAGSLRSPLFVGGGVIFGPKPRHYGDTYPKHMKRQALKHALLNKIKNIFLLKDIDVKEGKTKEVLELLKNFKASSALFIDEKLPEKLRRAAGNLKLVKAGALKDLNVYDLLKYESVFLSVKAGKKLAETMQ